MSYIISRFANLELVEGLPKVMSYTSCKNENGVTS